MSNNRYSFWNVFVIATSMTMAVISSCSKNDNIKEPLPIEYDVYVAGYEVFDYNNTAMLWKNGLPLYKLNNFSMFYSVVVSNNNIFVAGIESNGSNNVVNIWKNGQTLYTLTDKPLQSWSVAVSGNDVYVTGNEYDETEINKIVSTGKVWKNGQVLYTFSDKQQSTNAASIAVSDNDVYVAGSENGIAKLWKNGQVFYTLSDEQNYSSAISVAISGNDIYVAGNENVGYETIGLNNAVKVWKNGQLLYKLANSYGSQYTYASSMFVSGNDVYVVGDEMIESYSVRKIWKNGQILYDQPDFPYLTLTHSSSADAVYVMDNEVFVAGSECKGVNGQRVVMLWKDGVSQYNNGYGLTDGKNHAYARSVFVAPRF